MTYFSASVQQRICNVFIDNDLPLNVKSDHFVVKDSHACSIDRVQEIVQSIGFYPLISQNRINNDIVFTVSPYIIPNFFNQKAPYFTGSEIEELFNPKLFTSNGAEKTEDRWSEVNSFRSYVTPALSKGLCELISKYAKTDSPVIEIGSGFGYSLKDLSSVIRTQPCVKDCNLLSRSISEPVYRLDIQEIYHLLVESGKKISLFFALDVFDLLSPELRRASFLQLSQLQNPGDRILMMLDTNPCLDTTIAHLESLHPNHVVLPFYPLSNEPAKFSVILVPEKYVGSRPTQSQFIQIIYQESMLVMSGKVSSMQFGLHQLQKQLDLTVINLEDFYAEQVGRELSEAGYEADIYYHNSFTCGNLPEGLSGIEQDFVYRSVTDTCTLRQWSLTDEKLLESLSKKNLTIPSEFNEEFLTSLRERQEKIFGTEILVINAKKV